MTNSLAVNPADHANAPVDPANAFLPDWHEVISYMGGSEERAFWDANG